MAQKEHFVYVLNCEDGNKYVGTTTNIDRRFKEHFSGNGSAFTKIHQPESVKFYHKCSSEKSAKAAEKYIYYNMKAYYGIGKVRGACHTKSK